MKILIYDAYAKIRHDFPRGGSTRSLIDFLKMRDLNSQQEYYFLTNQMNKKYYLKHIQPLGIKELYIKFPKALLKYGKVYEKNLLSKLLLLLFIMPSFNLKVAFYLKKYKIDKVVGNELRASLTIGIATFIANKELTTFIRSDYGLTSKMAKICLGISSKVIAISEGIYDLLGENYKNKTKIINESIDIDNFLDERKTKIKSNDEPIKIVNIANISLYKNQITLVKAINEVIKDYRNVKLYIIGENFDNNCKKEMLKFINDNKLEDYIIFTGFQTDIKKYLSECDIYVQPSFNEGLGRSIIEAYLFEIPVIGSDIPGIKSIVENNVNGYLFDSKNYKQLYS
ncbi:glycosyltransferase, partial [Peribacillus butanolivorans]|uniref:glycosyltransferase n=1 Tax=Peribacillus butanolivorans TaxID=421767 RepID=UPI00207D4464